ncbi:MAG: hypothetical protein ACFE8O_10215 [Candidatus Hermodarchaeota archaeon]
MQIFEILFGIVIPFLIFWIAGSLILWIAGRIVSGPENAKFTDALWISLLGAILDVALTWVFDNFIAPALLPFGLIGDILILVIPLIVILIIYIWLIMRFFDTGVLGAFAVGILYIIFIVIIGIIMAILAVTLILLLLPFFP